MILPQQLPGAESLQLSNLEADIVHSSLR